MHPHHDASPSAFSSPPASPSLVHPHHPLFPHTVYILITVYILNTVFILITMCNASSSPPASPSPSVALTPGPVLLRPPAGLPLLLQHPPGSLQPRRQQAHLQPGLAAMQVYRPTGPDPGTHLLVGPGTATTRDHSPTTLLPQPLLLHPPHTKAPHGVPVQHPLTQLVRQ